jgi:hypothetical protein
MENMKNKYVNLGNLMSTRNEKLQNNLVDNLNFAPKARWNL